MRNLTIVIILLLVGIAGVGYYRGWFAFSRSGTNQAPSATITVDKAKFHEDEQKAKDKTQGFEQEAKDKIHGQPGKAEEPQRQP
jgi:predicted negative regulator of RcsB-dependent stress response